MRPSYLIKRKKCGRRGKLQHRTGLLSKGRRSVGKGSGPDNLKYREMEHPEKRKMNRKGRGENDERVTHSKLAALN